MVNLAATEHAYARLGADICSFLLGPRRGLELLGHTAILCSPLGAAAGLLSTAGTPFTFALGVQGTSECPLARQHWLSLSGSELSPRR